MMAGLKTYATRIGLIATGALSLVAWYISYHHGVTTSYNDAMSHLDISRLVVDNRQPGLSQLGSVWLPLSHVLVLPLIWNTWLWHTGLAGSLISMAAYVISVIGIYKLVRQLTGHRGGALAAAAIFALNLNELYLQSTPLTEPVYLALFIFTSYYLICYLRTASSQYLLPLGVMSALQILDRYDGWFVAVVVAAVLLYFELFVRRVSLTKALGNLIFFSFPVGAAVVGWLGWNLIIFHDPLYSFTGPYSAHAQQAVIQRSGSLITKGNLWESVKAFGYDVEDNVGSLLLVLGVAGWGVFLAVRAGIGRRIKVLMAIVLLSVILFNVLALYLGFSILNVPELHWNPSGKASGMLFNARYGILALPFVATGVGLLVARKDKSRALLMGLVVVVVCLVQTALTYHRGIITVQDGVSGSSAFANQDIAAALKADVKDNQPVLLSTSYFNAVAFESGLPLRQFIHEGVSSEWKDATANPDLHAQWIVMANGNVGEPVYTSLVVNEKNAFLRDYQLVFEGSHANLYVRKTTSQIPVTVQNGQLLIERDVFNVRGVNSYDLAYKSQPEIAQTFTDLKASGVNTVRFWVFGDGQADGFQPDAGTLNETRLQTLDYVLTEAHEHDIRVIPVLANNWKDYGGIDQYVAWAGLPASSHDAFYTNPQIIQLYENYINHIITRKNTITNQSYANDPTILAWDLLNEPRVTGGDTGLIASWAGEVGTYIKNIDRNHLVTIGTDKEVSDTAQSSICGVPQIDFCAVHLYIQDKDTLLYANQSEVNQAIARYRQVSSKLNKPIIVTEVGVSKATKPYGLAPSVELATILTSISRNQYSGWLIWNWSLSTDTSFGFAPDSPGVGFNDTQLKSLTGTTVSH